MARSYSKHNTISLYFNGSNQIHVSSGNGKLGKGVYNLSLVPGDGLATYKDGKPVSNIVGTCSGCCENCHSYCYALKFFRMYTSCKIAWSENTILFRSAINLAFSQLDRYFSENLIPYFRIHVSGEFFSREYMSRWMKFAADHNMTQFYFYTKRYAWLNSLYESNLIPTNVHPIVSPENSRYQNPHRFFEFVVDDGIDPEIAAMTHCPAVDKNGHDTGITCAKCRKCLQAKMGDKIACYLH